MNPTLRISPAVFVAVVISMSVANGQTEKTSRFETLGLKHGMKREQVEKRVTALLNHRNTYSTFGNNLRGGTTKYYDGSWVLAVVYKAGSPAPTIRTPNGDTRSLPPMDETVVKFTIKNEIAESRAFSEQVDRLRNEVGNPLDDIDSEFAGLRFLAVLKLKPRESKDHEHALASTLNDNVRWVRYSAAVQLGKAGLQAEKVAPVLVDALRGDRATFHLWGTTNHVMPAIYKIGSAAIPHLNQSIDAPNDRLRENSCLVLGQLASSVDEPTQFEQSLETLNAAIHRNKYPISRPIYVFSRMRIDGDLSTAEKLLSEDARSSRIEIRLAALKQMRRFFDAADHLIPLLIELLSDKDSKIVRSSLGTIRSLHQKGEFDVSAAVTSIAVQLEKRMENDLRQRFLKFLLDTKTSKHCPIDPVAKLLSGNPHTKAAAARVLGAMGPAAKSTLPALRKLSNDPNQFVRKAAKEALALISEEKG